MKIIIFTLISLLFIGSLALSPMYAYLTDEVITITVKDKERIVTGSGSTLSSKYLVYAEGEVFQNSDSLWYWKWNSADVQNELEEKQVKSARKNSFCNPDFLNDNSNKEDKNSKQVSVFTFEDEDEEDEREKEVKKIKTTKGFR